MKKIASILIITAAFTALALYLIPFTSLSNSNKIVVSNYALYDIAKALVPKEIKVQSLIPFGQEYHTFHVTPKDLQTISEAKLFMYVRPGLNHVLASYVHDVKPSYLDLTSHVKWREASEEHHQMHNDEEETNHVDPHYWFDTENQIKLTQVITSKLLELYPEHKEHIIVASHEYIDSLKGLDDFIVGSFIDCKHSTIAVTHNAFSYYTARYNFSSITLQGLSPESQTSPAQLERMINTLSKQKITTIFFETFVSNKAALVVSKQLNIRMKILATLGNIEQTQYEKGENYFSLMKQNTLKIAKARECK